MWSQLRTVFGVAHREFWPSFFETGSLVSATYIGSFASDIANFWLAVGFLFGPIVFPLSYLLFRLARRGKPSKRPPGAVGFDDWLLGVTTGFFFGATYSLEKLAATNPSVWTLAIVLFVPLYMITMGSVLAKRTMKTALDGDGAGRGATSNGKSGKPDWQKWGVIVPALLSVAQLVALTWLALSANSIAQNAFLSTQNQSFSYSVSNWNFTKEYSTPQQDVLQFKTVVVSESLVIATCCPNGKLPNLPSTLIHFIISVDGNPLFDKIIVETYNVTLTPSSGFSSSANPGQVRETFAGHWLVVSMTCYALRFANDTSSSCAKLTFLQIQIDGLLFHY